MGKMPEWFNVKVAALQKKEVKGKMPSWFSKKVGPVEERDVAAVGSDIFRGSGGLDAGSSTDQNRTEGEVMPINYSKAPRGIRNNNPGNVERTQPWQGMASPEEMHPSQQKETRFAVFKTPEFGIRAMGKVLQTYSNKHGLNTVEGIINRWAPPSENNTSAYSNAVAKALGVEPNATIDVSNPKVLSTLLRAIIRHENGEQPYSTEQITAGVNLALNIGEV